MHVSECPWEPEAGAGSSRPWVIGGRDTLDVHAGDGPL